MDEVSDRNFKVLAEGLVTVRRENADLRRQVQQLQSQLATLQQQMQLVVQQANALRVIGSTTE